MSQFEFEFAAQRVDSRRPRNQPFVQCLIFVVAGILLDDCLEFDFRVYALIGLTSILGWVLLRTFKSRVHAVRKEQLPVDPLGSVILMLGITGLGALWHHGYWNWYGEREVSRFVSSIGTSCCMEGTVVTEPHWITPQDSDDGMNYRTGTVRTRVGLKANSIRDGAQWISISGNLDLVIPERVTEIRAGDRVRVFGTLVPVEPPSNPGQFNFKAYYRAQRKLVLLHANFAESVTIVQPASRSFLRPLSLLRSGLNEVVWQNLNPDEAAFASALMLGNREQLSAERRESFLKTGTSHLLAISGLHVGILASSFFWLYRIGWLTRQTAIWITIGFVIFYVWLVEFRPPALRAAVLIVTFCIGKLLGKTGFGFNLLSLAGLIVLAANPRDLFNLGAQLSFLAVATLNFGSSWCFLPPPREPLDRVIANSRSWPVRTLHSLGRQVASAFLVSAAIWAVSLPLVAYQFHLVAPVALLVNPLLLLPLAWGLYSGLAMLVLGVFNASLAQIPGKICEWNLDFIETAIQLAESLPGGCSVTAGPTLFALVLFYAGLFFAAIFPLTRLRLRWIALLAISWYAFAWWLPDRIDRSDWLNGPRPLVCTFIDVNHGNAVLLQLPDGKSILYDGGSFGSSVYGYQSISSVLWSQRIERLDAVIISHADLDHYNALLELSQRFGIGELIITRQTRNSRSPSVQSLLARLNSLDVPNQIVDADQKTRPDGRPSIHPNLSILNPPTIGTGGNDNSDSIVVLVEGYGFHILLPGDLEGPGLERLISQPPIKCEVVMAPHHGSFNSDPSDFMKWANPDAVVISGQTQRIRENSVAVFEQNARTVFRTDLHGAIRCIVHAGQAKFQTWNGQTWLERPIQRQPIQRQSQPWANDPDASNHPR